MERKNEATKLFMNSESGQTPRDTKDTADEEANASFGQGCSPRPQLASYRENHSFSQDNSNLDSDEKSEKESEGKRKVARMNLFNDGSDYYQTPVSQPFDSHDQNQPDLDD